MNETLTNRDAPLNREAVGARGGEGEPIGGSFCRYRKASCFWSFGISLYLELFFFT